MASPIVIIGAGQAAASFVSRHTALGSTQPLLLIGEESHPPYQRPPLSKKYLLGELERDRLFIRPLDWYAEQGVETRFNTRVTEIRPAARQIAVAAGDIIDYDRLIICTGSSARNLPAEIGGGLDAVFTLRSIADIDRLSPEFRTGRRLLIVGGGYIGLEAAAAGRQLGLEVTVIEMAERIMQRVAARETSNYFRHLHSSHGVEIMEGAEMIRLVEAGGRACGAELTSGEIIDADLVLIGIGGSPNIELAQAANLECDTGIRVDGACRSSDPYIYAAGDCTSFERNGQQIRLESVQNAADQGDLVARVIAGEDVSYTALPWFWSDQYDCKLQIAGLNIGYDQCVVRPGNKDQTQSIWYYSGDRLLAVDAINDPKAYVFGRKMIESGMNPRKESVASPDSDLRAIAKG
ncbi:MAG: FAD-dependent oxidoreductase [Gammaproteobacteria bacterium]|nr:FAD-dependent oxidoreductase [Gammaproteobacteria bacterium]